MISPTVRMHGFDSPSFATLCTLAARRDTTSRHEVHLLHEAGHVLAVVDSVEGHIAAPFTALTDAADAARALRAERQADRAIVADVASLRTTVAKSEATVTGKLTQPGLMLLMQQTFRDCSGVVADPPLPSLDGWRALEQRLRDAGDGAFVLAAGTAPHWPIALRGRLEAGAIVEVTDLPAPAVAVLPALYGLPALLGERLAVSLLTSYDDLAATFDAADVGRAILDRLGEPVELS